MGHAQIAAQQTLILQGQLTAIQRDQRPYIALMADPEGPQYKSSDKLIWWNVDYSNIGRSSALKFRADLYMKLGGGKFLKTGSKDLPTSEFQPGTKRFFTVYSSKGFSSDNFDRLK